MTPAEREAAWSADMRASRRGDDGAYRRLLDAIAGLLRAYMRGRLSRAGLDSSDAEDIVQEILIGLHAKRHTWDEARAFMPWLNAIAQHKLVDAVRRLQRERRHRAEVSAEDWENAFEAAPTDLDRHVVDVGRHLALLPAAQRQVVEALALEQVSVAATAKRLGASEGAVRMTLHRALRRLSALARHGRLAPGEGES